MVFGTTGRELQLCRTVIKVQYDADQSVGPLPAHETFLEAAVLNEGKTCVQLSHID